MLTPFEKTLMHGVEFSGENLAGWYGSEKFRGHRVRWDGTNLLSRRGHNLHAPDWFTASLPKCAVDGELFASKIGGEDEVSSILQSRHRDWKRLRVMAFDLPGSRGDYCDRHSELLESGFCVHYAQPVTLFEFSSTAHAIEYLRIIVSDDGEGLMLHRPGLPYVPGRTQNLLKLLPGNALG